MGVSPSAVSRVCGVEVSYKNFNSGRAFMLPQRLAVVGQGNDDSTFSEDKFLVEGNANAVAEKYGYGSPVHLASLQLFPQIGTGADFPVTIYPLKKADGAEPAKGSVSVEFSGAESTATETGSAFIFVGGVKAEFVVKKGDNADAVLQSVKKAVDSVLKMPVKTEDVAGSKLPLVSKWSGESSNLITLEVKSKLANLVFTVEKFTGGAKDPNVETALKKVGPVWETFVLDCFNYNNETRLDTYQSFGEERWGAFEKKPVLVCHGCTDDFATRTAVSDKRKKDYINFLIVSVKSRELPFVIAARAMLHDVVSTANANPPQGYKGLLAGLHCGKDEEQENYQQRNMSVLRGSSTNIKNGSVAELNDVVTFYHPESEGTLPSKRYVVDLVKLMNVVFNARLIMDADNIKSAPMVSDDTVTSNKRAVQPKVIRTSFMNLADSLALQAIIQEPKFTKKKMVVEIDDKNPKRLNVAFPVKLSGNVEISDTMVYFGFYLGGE